MAKKTAETDQPEAEPEAQADPKPTDPRICEPAKADPEALAVLGAKAWPTGLLRLALCGSHTRLQCEWSAEGRAAWFDLPHVVVDSLADVRVTSEA